MHAYEIPNLRFSMPAGGEVLVHRFVSVAADKAVTASADTAVIGVSMNEVTAKELEVNERIVEIADGIVMVEAAGAINAGAKVYSNATGQAAASGTDAVGIAMTSATGAGSLLAVKL